MRVPCARAQVRARIAGCTLSPRAHGHGDASGPLRQAHRPILNADGSLSEFPFVLTWFPIPEWDDSESDEEGPSPADAESEEPESEPESEDDREIPDDECW